MPDTRTRQIRIDIDKSASTSKNPCRHRKLCVDIEKSASTSENPIKNNYGYYGYYGNCVVCCLLLYPGG
eukprot:10389373-Heterocapsa_arctica.AAC.1